MLDNEIDASPTKEFFISMLVKDIVLSRAILDLCDNCVDGARRLRPNNDFNGLTIRIEISEKYFKITDNCGGIPTDIARDYAFRFGRPSNTKVKPTPHSVGQFGVGMKRSLFKIGTSFKIESRSEHSHFTVAENVDLWKQQTGWKFEFKTIEEHLPIQPEAIRGTILLIDKLHDNVSTEFGLENFRTRLISEIEAAHQLSIGQGLAITLNQIPIKLRTSELFVSEQIQPANKVLTFEEEGKPPVSVKIICGISISDPANAGWYIYCNGRLILGPDQTIVTGWGEGNGSVIPKYHNTHARFRGYVFFDCDDASRLPWNTTKTGVDYESRYFQAVRLEMISLMRPVIDFTNRLAAEVNSEETNLETAIDNTIAKDVSAISTRESFKVVQVSIPPELQTRRIQYSKPLEEIQKVKKALGATTLKGVGEKTFEYFFTAECDD